MNDEALPRTYFGFSGPLRDTLVTAILRGEKTATSSLAVEYDRENEPLPVVGDRQLIVDSHDEPVGVLEVTEVRVVPAREIDDAFARAEGEGFTSTEQWWAAHQAFWVSDEVRAELGEPEVSIDPDIMVVAERFRLIEQL